MRNTIEPVITAAAAATPGHRLLTFSAWASTGVFAVVMTVSGIAFVVGPPPVRTMLEHLGYPPYLRSLLGVAKLLGAAALLIPGLRTLREWSYAGFTVLFAGAIASHLLAGDGPAHLLPAALLGTLLLVSRWLRRATQGQEIARG